MCSAKHAKISTTLFSKGFRKEIMDLFLNKKDKVGTEDTDVADMITSLNIGNDNRKIQELLDFINVKWYPAITIKRSQVEAYNKARNG